MSTVHIEFQRVQNWLFSVPRLRAMVGANSLLGGVLRVELPELARRAGAWSLTSASGDYPLMDVNDPLKDHDNPAADASDGILSRDGGHFEALFATGARAFAEEASTHLVRRLPGLKFRISIDGITCDKANAEVSAELPVFSRCEWMGKGLASHRIRQGDEHHEVAIEVSRRHNAARLAENHQASDLASLLTESTPLGKLRRLLDFNELAGDGYLAVIHADGNGVGRAAAAESDEASRSAFFHGNRVLLRRALQVAIGAACEGAMTTPLLLLMLGGDDVLVVCRAASALPFVVDLCRELERLQTGRSTKFRLTLGSGVVFSKSTVPFHRLYEVAENLAASAKRRFRAQEAESVADWAVYTTAWADDPEETRRRNWVYGSRESKRVLSLRPLNVLGEGLRSLEGLLRSATNLAEAPRSQLRYLVDQLHLGKALSDLAYAELSKKARKALNDAGVSEVWTRSDDEKSYLTSVLDLVEVFEIDRLGRVASERKSANVGA
jgi:hypothetical protein